MGDIDMGLRMAAQMRPADMAAPFVNGDIRPDALPEAIAKETQLSRRELRLDKVLAVQVDGQRRLLHVEFQLDEQEHMAMRCFEYAGALAMSVWLAERVRVPIMSVVVLIEGADDIEPGWVSESIGWPGHQGGQVVTYWREPVYRYTIAELRARPPLWWIFAPLVRDIDAASMEVLLRELRERVNNEEQVRELAAVMRLLSERNQRIPSLGDRIAAIIGEETIMQSEFLNKIRREEARERLLRIAARLASDEELADFRAIEDVDTLERQVVALVDASCNGKRETGSDDT